MKKNMTNIGKMLFAITAILILAMSQPLHAQSTKTATGQNQKEILANELIDEEATYPGGESGLLKDISTNLKYPVIAAEMKTQGTVVLRFIIKKNGSIGDIVIRKGLTKECDQAAINAVKKLRKFTPAKHKGTPVAVWFSLPIRFRIN